MSGGVLWPTSKARDTCNRNTMTANACVADEVDVTTLIDGEAVVLIVDYTTKIPQPQLMLSSWQVHTCSGLSKFRPWCSHQSHPCCDQQVSHCCSHWAHCQGLKREIKKIHRAKMARLTVVNSQVGHDKRTGIRDTVHAARRVENVDVLSYI